MRSKLFVPASRPELFAKALGGEADAISFDLEDAVQESRKVEARRTLQAFLKERHAEPRGKVIIVRVNGLRTPHFEADVAAVAWPGVDMINLPKPESADAIRAAAAVLARYEAERGITRPLGILANIESPRGLRLAAEIATADPRLAGLQLGLGDLFEPSDIDRKDAQAVHSVQLAVRMAAAEAGRWVCDTVYAAVNDPEGFTREAEAARRLGYIGKSCIHPTPGSSRQRRVPPERRGDRGGHPRGRRRPRRGGPRGGRLPRGWPHDRSALHRARRGHPGRRASAGPVASFLK